MQEERGKIDELKQSLYKRGQEEKQPRKWARFTKKKPEVQDDWKHDHVSKKMMVEVRRPDESKRSLSIRFFVFSVIFFLIALGVAAFIIGRGSNVVSSENIDLVVSGPVSVAGGESLELQIDIANGNNTTLELVDLVIEFPEGTRDPEQPSEELLRLRESLGSLTPGEGESRNISALIFGEEDDKKQIMVGIEYRVVGSNAIFFKESAFDVQIGTAPISLLINMPTELDSGKEMTVVAEVISNASEALEDVALSIEYPFGFSFEDAQPKSDVGDGIWLLGDLAPQERRTINVTGIIEGQDSEERTFRFVGGLSSGVDTEAIDTVLIETKRTLAISRPFLQADLVFGGGTSSESYVAEPGQGVSGTVLWQNNLSVPVENAQIEIVFDSDVIDETSISTLEGFYRSIDNTIIWDRTRKAELSLLEPGARGQLSFEFSSVDPLVEFFERGSIDLSLHISGNRTGNTPDTTGKISSSISKTVKVASGVSMSTQSTYSTGPFSNTGPFPPKVEEPTTFTIIWTVSNASNHLSDAKVSASLPTYVELVGPSSPANESVKFNSVGSEVVWELGPVTSGSGFTRPPREVAFQVRMIPSISQVGTVPLLMGPATFTAHDTFSKTTRRTIGKELTTAVTKDPGYVVGAGKVVQ